MEKNSDEMIEMGNRPPLKRPRQVVSNQSGASSETPVAPKDLDEDTDWPDSFVEAITSVSDSDEIRTLVATGLLFFECYSRPGVMSKIRKILRQEERCGGGYAKPISSGASSETRRSLKNLSDDASWVDLIVKEITSASDSDDARIRATKVLESFKESLFTLLMSEMRHNLQQASGYARSDLLGLDDSDLDDEDDMPCESSAKMEMEKKKMNCSVDGALVSNPVLVDLIVKEITSASDLDDARIRVIRALESLKAPMISEKKQNLQKERCSRCGYARPFSVGMDDSEEDENDMRYESPPKMEMEKKISCSAVQDGACNILN